jgi:hypothetical protein
MKLQATAKFQFPQDLGQDPGEDPQILERFGMTQDYKDPYRKNNGLTRGMGARKCDCFLG